MFHIVEVTATSWAPSLLPPSLAGVERIIEQHALRGFDAIHLCAALSLGTPEFACFDTRLRKAAEAEGLGVIP